MIYSSKGFTLVEVLVSIFIFSIIMLAVGSSFVSALNVQRHAFNVQQVQENASYVIDTILKEVRVSEILPPVPDSCVDTPAVGDLTVGHPDFGPIHYYMTGGNIIRENSDESLQLNSNAIEFTNFKFCISGSELRDGQQSRITMYASMRSTKGGQQEIIDIQTTISPRLLNN